MTIFKKQRLMKELMMVMAKYIALLTQENLELIALASVHGWKSKRYEAGVQCRREIREIADKLGWYITVTNNLTDAIERNGMPISTN